jgi:hypothetical protein
VIAYKALSPPQQSPSPQSPPPQTETFTVQLQLTANVTSIKPGDTITFVAKLEPYAPGAQFVFDFGDGQSAEQEDPEVSHSFKADRDYEVTVTARLAKQQVHSEPLHITVHSTPTPTTLDLTWTPLHPAAGKPVVFTATLEPPNPAITQGPYTFYFGNQAKATTPENTYSQTFERYGTYPVRVTLRGEHGHVFQSALAELTVVEPPTTNWPKYVALAAAMTLMVSFVGLHFLKSYFTGLVALRAVARTGSVHLHQDGRDGLEAAFGFKLEQPAVNADAEFRGPVIRKVERVR